MVTQFQLIFYLSTFYWWLFLLLFEMKIIRTRINRFTEYKKSKNAMYWFNAISLFGSFGATMAPFNLRYTITIHEWVHGFWWTKKVGSFLLHSLCEWIPKNGIIIAQLETRSWKFFFLNKTREMYTDLGPNKAHTESHVISFQNSMLSQLWCHFIQVFHSKITSLQSNRKKSSFWCENYSNPFERAVPFTIHNLCQSQWNAKQKTDFISIIFLLQTKEFLKFLLLFLCWCQS